MGSQDRRLLSSMAYGFYRLGHALRHLSIADRILTGLFLCNDQPNDLLRYFRPGWDPSAGITEKIAFFQQQQEAAGFHLTDIFPWAAELSPGIDPEAFCLSFLRQPDLFLRIRPGYDSAVRQKLDNHAQFIPPSTLRLPNGFNIEESFHARPGDRHTGL